MKGLFSKKLYAGLALLSGIAIFFSGCQKELDGAVFSFGCKLKQWANVDSAGNATETFDFTYDSATGTPIILTYNDIIGGASQTVVPVFKKDTVYFSPGSYAVLDNSKRIYRLEERNSVNPSAPDGSYFYTYDASGHIASRIYDDGIAAQTTTYTFTGDELTKANEPILGVANAITITYTYSASAKVKDYNVYIFSAAFPELTMYLPCFSIGRFTDKAIEKTALKVNVPFPIPEVTTNFSNYQFDTKGNITRLQLDQSITGVPLSAKSFLSGSHLCR